MQIDISKIKEEFRDLIRKSIREELQTYNPPPPQYDPNELLTIQQVVDLLQISKVSLHSWKRDGRLPFLRMGRRVYFKRGEVMAAMESVNHKKQQP